MDLRTYKDRVWALAARRDGEAVFNGSPEHAAIIVERLFATANSHVRLLTGDLDAKVYADPAVVQTARQFLSHSDHQLDVLVEDESFSPDHALVALIGSRDNARMFRVPAAVSEILPYHFMTADDDSFRFEGDKNTHTAIAAFGDRAGADNLNGIFAKLIAHCPPIQKPASVS